MLLKTFKSNSTFNLLIFPLIAIAFWMKDLLEPRSYAYVQAENHNVLYAPVYGLVENHPLLQVVIALVLLIAIAFLIQVINDRFLFIRIRTKLPAILFVVIVAGFTQMHTLHPVYFAAVFLLFAISRFFGIFEKSKPWSALFDVGLLLGIGSLFYLNLTILVPAFLAGVYTLTRKVKWRQYVILLLGFILPFIYATSYFFITDTLDESIELFTSNLLTPINHFRTNYPLHGYLSILILFTLTGSISMVRQYDYKKVSSRRYFTIFFLVFIFSMFSFVFIPATSQEMLVINAIPVTYLMANLLVFMKSRFWSEFVFSVLMVAVVILQFL
jgi:hypothetical protein